MRYKHFLILVVAVMGAMCTAWARNAKAVNPGDTVRVLWIGNSFTFFNDVPEMVRKLAAAEGVTMLNTTVLKGGEKFSGHLQNPALADELAKGGWDFMIMQEFSSGPAYSTKYVMENIFPYAEAIDSMAHAFSPDLQTVFYMTWGTKTETSGRRPTLWTITTR